MTKKEVTALDLPYISAIYDYANTAYVSSIQDRDGFVKILADPETRGIMGCHITRSEASILIQEAVNMHAGLTTEAITRSICVHPTLPEVVQRAFFSLPFRMDHDH